KQGARDPLLIDGLESSFREIFNEQRQNLQSWIDARHRGDSQQENQARAAATKTQEQIDAIRKQAAETVNPKKKTSDADYVFITFILDYLPHGLIGLLVAAFFAAALSAKAAELNALASTTTIDIFRHVIQPDASARLCLLASKCF